MSKHKFKIRLSQLTICLMMAIAIIIPKLILTQATGVNSITATFSPSKSGWQSVPIGGGGFVTGIYAHPQEADLIYMQTDNGGAYRWLPRQQKWQNIIDKFPLLPWNYYGVETLALDPQNPELIYMALGKYTSNSNSSLWKSGDRGQTWSESDLTVPMGADEDKRWAGNRLVVSPHDSNLLLFGSRLNGLWRSTDAGLHWTVVESLNANPQEDIGIIAVAFDPQDEQRIYASAYGDGIYASDDASATWSKMEGSPARVMKMVAASDRSLYATSDVAPGVSKWSNDTWQDITPSGYQGQVFNALSVDPQHQERILTALGEVGDIKIFVSTDGGNHWQQKSTKAKTNETVTWWTESFFNDHTAAVIFDPHHANRVWLSDWFGVWRTDNFGDRQSTWKNYPQGQEQLVTFSLLAPPQGAALLSGVADVEGFYHHSLADYPQDRLSRDSFVQGIKTWKSYWQDTYSLAYCLAKPLDLVRVGGKRDNRQNTGATSVDGGITWQEFTNFPSDKIPLRVAVSATKPQQFMVVRSEGQALHTKDSGKSWQLTLGLPNGIKGPWNWAQPLAADGADSEVFYYHAAGNFYRSSNGGANFTLVNDALPVTEDLVLKTVPGIAGEAWLSLGDRGLYFSVDGGDNFTPIESVEQSKLISFGKSPKGVSFPMLYLYGRVSQQGEGLFVSGDRGKTWRQLDRVSLFSRDAARTIQVLEASKKEPGLVFVGTDGRGIYYQYVRE